MKIPSFDYEQLTKDSDRLEWCTDFFARQRMAIERVRVRHYSKADQTFDNFKVLTEQQVPVVNLCQRFSTTLRRRIVDDKRSEFGFIFSGTTGTGKTHLANATLKLCEQCRVPGVYITAADLFELCDLREKQDPTTHIVTNFIRSGVLVIDEVGLTTWTPREQKRLQTIFDGRVGYGLPTIFCTNLQLPELGQAIGDRLVSRILGQCKLCGFEWEDYRIAVSPNCIPDEELF